MENEKQKEMFEWENVQQNSSKYQVFGLMEYVYLREANTPWTKNFKLNILHFSLYVFFIYI